MSFGENVAIVGAWLSRYGLPDIHTACLSVEKIVEDIQTFANFALRNEVNGNHIKNIYMEKSGLVLEGGGMRGLFSAGVTDVLMESGIEFGCMVGVSAGAAFGCNYKSRQAGRAIRYNVRFCRDRRYCSLWSLITTGNLFGSFCYHEIPDRYDIFDCEAFNANPMGMYVVCTDVDTGQAVYHRCDEATHTTYDWIRASASMPLASKIVHLGGLRLLDGGVADSIPLAFMEGNGYGRNVVVLTQPEGFVKRPSGIQPLLDVWMRRHPRFVEAMRRRPAMYNAELALVAERERQGRAFVIRPAAKLPINHISHSPEMLMRTYELGRKAAHERLAALRAFMASE